MLTDIPTQNYTMTHLEILKEIVLNGRVISPNEIKSIILPILHKIPVPTTTAKSNSFIERAVIIGKEESEITPPQLASSPNCRSQEIASICN